MPRRNENKHVGNPMSHFFRRRNGDADDLVEASDMTPVDLAAVQADDALLNTLGRTDVARTDTDAELARVLMAWRREVDTESIGPLDIDTAVMAISAARKPAARRHSMLGAVATAAAVLVVAFAGIGLGAKSAHPGDNLFPLTKVLYSEYARSVEAAQMAENELDQAETALEEGDTSQARQSLERVQEQLGVIAEEQGRDRLTDQHRKLRDMLQEAPSPTEPTSTPSPPPSPSGVPAEPPVPPSAPATSTTTPVEPSESKPPTTAPTTPPSPTASAVPEPPTVETRSSGGAGPVDSEESPPPTVTASSR